ncbi:MAG: MotA/TolQ/ExbB proton channel family protein [bacterium]|nr:MotA/TolQ/ExbB proton channel family protein [bacterium]
MNEIMRFVLQSGFVAKVILLILFILSIISWGIIIEKTRLFRKVFHENDKFSRLFTTRSKWNDRVTYSREFKASPMAKIFRKNFTDLKAWIEISLENNGLSSTQSRVNKQQVPLRSIFEVAISEEMTLLEKGLVFLGTTVSVSPFLGLLGTVWGIMTSFMSMGVQGSAAIATVGPGIADALITTVAGLAVAIPALVANNYFINRLDQISKDTENFFATLMINIERERPL